LVEHEGDAEAEILDSDVSGLVVLTQTCDLVRATEERPYAEVCPLVAVDEAVLAQIKAGQRPGYLYIPSLEAECLVGDLDRVMTIQKAVLAKRERKAGWTTDEEARQISEALARKRARFAFPDDFNLFVGPLQDRLKGKHGKESPEGGALRALREIRIHAEPNWDAAEVELMFWFIRRDGETGVSNEQWPQHLKSWLERIPASGRFQTVEGQVVSLDDMTAREYVESDALDLDHLSAKPAAQ
jgi:hypothetical protein